VVIIYVVTRLGCQAALLSLVCLLRFSSAVLCRVYPYSNSDISLIVCIELFYSRRPALIVKFIRKKNVTHVRGHNAYWSSKNTNRRKNREVAVI